MIEAVSAVTLDTHEMPRAVRFYRALGFEALKFMTNYASGFGKAAGKGSWYLLVGGVGALLYHAGVGKDLIDSIWGHMHLPK